MSESISAGEFTFTHDATDQLTAVNGPASLGSLVDNRAWRFDGTGNRTDDSILGGGSSVNNIITQLRTFVDNNNKPYAIWEVSPAVCAPIFWLFELKEYDETKCLFLADIGHVCGDPAKINLGLSFILAAIPVVLVWRRWRLSRR